LKYFCTVARWSTDVSGSSENTALSNDNGEAVTLESRRIVKLEKFVTP